MNLTNFLQQSEKFLQENQQKELYDYIIECLESINTIKTLVGKKDFVRVAITEFSLEKFIMVYKKNDSSEYAIIMIVINESIANILISKQNIKLKNKHASFKQFDQFKTDYKLKKYKIKEEYSITSKEQFSSFFAEFIKLI